MMEPNGDFPKLSKPAQRALASAGIHRVSDLTKWTEADFSALHGIGPTAVAALKQALKDKNLSFKR